MQHNASYRSHTCIINLVYGGCVDNLLNSNTEGGDLCSVLAMSSGYTFIVLCVPPPTAQVEWLPGAYSREDNVKISQIK